MRVKRYQHGRLDIRPRKHGPSIWQFRYSENGKLKAVILGTVEQLPTQSDAERAAESVRVRINSGHPEQRLDILTVGNLADQFLREELDNDRMDNDRRFMTKAVYRSYIEQHIRPQWGSTPLGKVSPMAVQHWLQILRGKKTEKPLAPKTKAHIRNLFYLLFQRACLWEWTDKNPIQWVQQSNRRLREPRVLTTAEFKALVAKLANPYRAMVLVAGCLGLRVSEIMGLQWADVDWEHLQVFVRRSVVAGRGAGTKNTASRKPVPLDPELATALVAWRDAAKFTAPTDFLFPGDTGGPRWQGMISKQHIQPAATAAEISGKVGWHTFRHSYRAWLKRAGTPVEVQKELMRHSNIKTTLEIYGLEPDVTPANREANSGVVKLLMGK